MSGPELLAFYEDVMTPHERRNPEEEDAVLVLVTSHEALTYVLAQLRHGYEQLSHGYVLNQQAFAKGLLGPAIERLERIQRTFAQVTGR